MDHVAHIVLVDAHAKCARRDHHLDLTTHPLAVVQVLDLRVDLRMVVRRSEAARLQRVAHALGFTLRVAVNDCAAPALGCRLERRGDLVGGRTS